MFKRASMANRFAALFILCAVLSAGCGGRFALTAKSDVGKAAQAADIEKALVEEAMTQFAVLHFKGVISDANYATGRKAHGTWATAQTTVAKSVAAWKRIGDAESGQAVMVAIQEAQKLAASLLHIFGQFGVDIGAARDKVGG